MFASVQQICGAVDTMELRLCGVGRPASLDLHGAVSNVASIGASMGESTGESRLPL